MLRLSKTRSVLIAAFGLFSGFGTLTNFFKKVLTNAVNVLLIRTHATHAKEGIVYCVLTIQEEGGCFKGHEYGLHELK